MIRVKNVKDTIYLLIFQEPTYAFQISTVMYGQENKRVFLEIKGLLEQRWIEEFETKVFVEKDKRSKRRIYYQADVRPILDYIHDITKKETLPDRTNNFCIESTLNSLAFRHLIKRNLPEHFMEKQINAIDFILTHFDFLVVISSQNNYIKKFTKNIKEAGDYEDAIKSLGKDKRFTARSPELCELLYGEKNTPVDVIEQLPHLFIFPEKLTDFYPGFSSFGIKYFDIISKARAFSNLFESSKIKKI